MKKQNIPTIILVLIAFVGLALILYPSVSDYWNSQTQSRALIDYESQVSTLSEEDKSRMLADAHTYNTALAELEYPLSEYASIEGEGGIVGYDEQMKVDEAGVMGSLSIPKIGLRMPFYHGVGDSVLNVAIGHLPGTSLPVGGTSTHCVLSAHRGLPRAKLFTDLDQLQLGDRFTIFTLGQRLDYEVDQITIILPNEVEALYVQQGEDLVTLMTCTPYGINTHRLLVRGHRVDSNGALADNIPAEAVRIDSPTIALAAIAFALFALLIWHPRRERADDSVSLAEVRRLHKRNGGKAHKP